MIPFLACLGTLVAGYLLGLYTHDWVVPRLGITYAPVHETGFSPPLLTAQCPRTDAESQSLSLAPHIRNAMRRIDAHLFESVTQALQVVGQSRDHVSLEPLLIILPFLLSVALTRCWPFGRRASLSTASSRSRTSCCGSFSYHHLQEARVARSDSDYAIRSRGRSTLRSYGVDRRPNMLDIPPVEFPALNAELRLGAVSPDVDSSSTDDSSVGETVQCCFASALDAGERRADQIQPSYASAADATKREIFAVVTIQYWFRKVFWPKFHPKPQRTLQDAHSETVDIDDSLHSETVKIDESAEATGDQGESRHPGSSRRSFCSDDDENDISNVSTPLTLTDTGPGSVPGNLFSYGCSVIRENTEVISEDFATALLEADENVCQGDSDAYVSTEPAVSATKALYVDSEYGAFCVDAEPSDVDNSGLSEETTYIALPQPNPSAEALIQHFAELHRIDTAATFSSTPPPPPSARKVFGELLDFCGQKDAITFTDLLQELGVEGCLKLRETRQSEIFRVCGVRGVAVLKVVHCGYIVRHLPCLLNEVVVGSSLRKLINGVENRTRGFCELTATYCVWDKYPDLIQKSCINYVSRKSSTFFGESERELFQPYAVLCMSFAGLPLPKVKFENALQLRSVVQQVALTLAAAEVALEFEHRALTMHHVLVKEAEERVDEFRLLSSSFYVNLHGIRVSIVDFAASRMCADIGTLPTYADLTKMSAEKKNAVGESFSLVEEEVSADMSQFHPYTNVIFLSDLIRGLRGAYEMSFEDMFSCEEERDAWRHLEQWSDDIVGCSGATDFVAACVLETTLQSSPSLGEGIEEL